MQGEAMREKLLALLAKCMPGPWHVDPPPYSIYVWGPDMEMVADMPTDDEDAYLARMRGVGRGLAELERLETLRRYQQQKQRKEKK